MPTEYTADEITAMDAEREAELDKSRGILAEDVNSAIGSLRRGTRMVAHLCSDSVYDIEFADGTVGADVAALLEEAGRLARAAAALIAQASR